MDLVLLHGLGADRRAFQRFERLLPADWDKRSLDLLGHGEAPKPEHGYSLDDHARYLARRLRELYVDAGRAAPVVVGHSYGAASGVATAALFPELVRALVLLDPVVYEQLGATEQMHNRTEQMIRARREGTLEATVPRLFPDESPALQRYTIDTWQRMAHGVVDEIDHDWMRFAARVRQPVTIVHGDVDKGAGGPRSASHFPHARTVRVDGAGHWLHATHARQTADAVAAAAAAMSTTA